MRRTTIDFGIDLGTTNSAIAVLRGADTEVIKNDQQMDVTPSVVAVDRKGRKCVGLAAKNTMKTRPDQGFREFKRQMGSEWRGRLGGSGEEVSPESLSADVLRALLESVEVRLGERPPAAVITIPANFKNPACEATRRAAELAGLQQSPLVQEPVAAALAYGFQRKEERCFWMVYDLGGGTFDAAVIRVRDEMIQVVNHGGNEYLGGKDIDAALMERVVFPALRRQFAHLDIDPANPKWRPLFSRILFAVEGAKVALSTKKSVPLEEISFSPDGRLSGDLWFECELTREDVEQAADRVIDETIRISRSVMSEKGLGPGDIEKVLLVGGPTLMPYLRERLRDRTEGLGVALEVSVDPMTVVARGAAVFAGTQRLRTRAPKPFSREVVTLELEFDPVGTDTEPIVGGRASCSDVTSFDGYEIQFARAGWTGERIKVACDGTFSAVLFADEGVKNIFEIRLFDGQGRRRTTDPDQLTYVVGMTISEQPLTASVGVELADGEFHALIRKGTPLPARAKARYRHVAAGRAGGDLDGEGRVVIPLIQGENRRACRNLLIGRVEVGGDESEQRVPPNSDVEVFLEVDSSQNFHVTVYVPILDREVRATYEYHRPTPDKRKLAAEFEAELQRRSELREKAAELAGEIPDKDLSGLWDDELVREIESLFERAEEDRDALEKTQRRLLDLQLSLDEVDEALNWPVLRREAHEELRKAWQEVKRSDESEDERELREIERDLKAAIRSRDTSVTREKVGELTGLRYRILARDPGVWVQWFQQCEERQADFRDPKVGARLLAHGRRAIERGDTEVLKAVVRQLVEQLPSEKTDRGFVEGFGSTIVSEL